MEKDLVKDEAEKEFLSHPKILENYSLLKEIDVFKYLDTLNREIHNFKSLFNRGLDIFKRTTTDEIMDATVWQISDYFLPSLIAFLWKPNQNREDITIKAYRNYQPVDLQLTVDSLAPLEFFFKKYPEPIDFNLLAEELKNDEFIKKFEIMEPAIVIPILGQLGLYGIIVIGPKILENGYSSEELQFLHQFMSFVSLAIKSQLHYENSMHDVKTGLYNHGFFMTRLNEEIARTKRVGYNSSIIVIDVDKFKNFNDTYGHLAGDQVLEYIARAIKQSVRNDDIPSRFGGEEFLVLLPNSDRTAAWMVAERLRTNIAAMTVPWKTPLPEVTVSMGVCVFDNSVDVKAEDILLRADDALYLSKERGRNCTTIWGSGLMYKMIKKGLA